jgi:enamine deaminase RidA (YjgF/YER057c/UK114 family)
VTKQAVHTPDAPQAIGTCSQATCAGNTVYLSGQIALDPATMQLTEGIDAQVHRVFRVAARRIGRDRSDIGEG